ncbi:MAG: hypothetical protein ABI718_04345 [Acidobacteriota bacterium]
MKPLIKFLVVFSLLIPAPLMAWGEKGHYAVNEAATYGTPTSMPAFFLEAFPRLVYLAYDPDRWRSGGDSIESVNPPNHFLDYEFVSSLSLPRKRYEYIALLYSSGTLRQHSLKVDGPGFLPWKIAETADLLELQWRMWRRSQPGTVEREQIEQNIINAAGLLGHYVGDAANPDHATVNYNGWTSPNPNGYPIDCDAHWRFETQFVSRDIEASSVFPLLRPAQLRGDYFATALEEIRESNGLVEFLYRLDRDGAFQPHSRTEPAGRQFALERLAAGASYLRDLWWSAYVRSGEKQVRED